MQPIGRATLNFRTVTDQMLGRPSLTFCEDRILGSIKKWKPDPARRNDGVDNKLWAAYIANNAMKLNLRLGNINHSVENAFGFLQGKDSKIDTLILGADLIHPKQGNTDDTPAIAALAGSFEETLGKFLGSARRQTNTVEYIVEQGKMYSMACERIKKWTQTHNGNPPRRILYYRDGVSEDQYKDVRRNEIPQIKRAWQKVGGRKGDPLVTAVIVTKRHHTRFYPHPNATFGNGQMTKFTKNCTPGTVVDSQITSPYYFDFYLQSHDTLQGSAKPTHYSVLENDMGFRAEQLQDLTYALCCTFAHSTSAVSYVSPAYYADKLCERAALYMKPFYDGEQFTKNMKPADRKEAMDFTGVVASKARTGIRGTRISTTSCSGCELASRWPSGWHICHHHCRYRTTTCTGVRVGVPGQAGCHTHTHWKQGAAFFTTNPAFINHAFDGNSPSLPVSTDHPTRFAKLSLLALNRSRWLPIMVLISRRHSYMNRIRSRG